MKTDTAPETGRNRAEQRSDVRKVKKEKKD